MINMKVVTARVNGMDIIGRISDSFIVECLKIEDDPMFMTNPQTKKQEVYTMPTLKPIRSSLFDITENGVRLEHKFQIHECRDIIPIDDLIKDGYYMAEEILAGYNAITSKIELPKEEKKLII